MTKQNHYMFLTIIAACISYFLQMNMYMEHDVAYVLHTAAQFMHGETYAHGIYEPNPPLIFWLMYPPLFISKLLQVNLVSIFYTYVISISIFSVGLIHSINLKLFASNLPLIKYCFITLLFVFLFFPMNEFGQREHILMLLSYPYFFLILFRMQEKTRPSICLSSMVGIFAAIGFAIKPHFLPALMLAEVFYLCQQRSWRVIFRPETFIIAGFFLAYAGIVFCYYQDYWQVILPMWLPFYQSIKKPLFVLILLQPNYLFCCEALLLSLVGIYLSRSLRLYYKFFSVVMIGFIITYHLHRVDWFYHIMPASGIACLLLTILLYQFCMLIKNRYLNLLLILLLFWTPLFQTVIAAYAGYDEYHHNKNLQAMLSYFKHEAPNNSFDAFTLTHRYIFLETYGHAPFVGSFIFFPWEFYAIGQSKHFPENKYYEDKIIPLMRRIVVNDLLQKKPHFVLLEPESGIYYGGTSIDFVAEFKQQLGFEQAWRPYRLEKKFGNYLVYVRH